MLIVGKKDVVQRLGIVSRYAWEKAFKEGALKPIHTKFMYSRHRYLAKHVEEVFGLPKGSVGEARQ